jgi:type VI secretion system secreted protein Hcp
MACLLVIPMSTNAAIYMFIEGVPGDSQDQDHRDWIDVVSVQEAMTMTPPDFSGGGSGGRAVIILDTSVTKEMDKSSPLLRQKLTEGRPIPQIIIHFAATYSSTREVYFSIRYTNAYLTSVSMSASGSDGSVPTENLSFTFETVEWEYTHVNPDGSKGGTIPAGWSVIDNRPI